MNVMMVAMLVVCDGDDDGGLICVSLNYNVIIAAILHDLRFPAHIILIGLNHKIMQLLNLAEN